MFKLLMLMNIFYQVSCLYLHVPSFYYFPHCLTYEFGSNLEISVSHLENEIITRKHLQEMFEEHYMKVSCLYPEVHDRLKKTDISRSTIIFQFGNNHTNVSRFSVSLLIRIDTKTRYWFLIVSGTFPICRLRSSITDCLT